MPADRVPPEDPPMPDHDSPWKELVGRYFPEFLAFFFPDIAAEADPAEDADQLEQELRKLLPSSETGKRVVDRLVKLNTRGGDTRFLHVELQGQKEDDFPRRVHVYNSRASDHLGQDVVSAAVLLDDDPDWKPTTYVFECWGCKKTFEFPVVKVVEWVGREAELEAHQNPVGLFVATYLAARRTAGDERAAEDEKLRLTLLMTDRILDGEERRHWYRFLDWLLPLPADANQRVFRDAERQRGGEKVAFITWIEKQGIEKGLAIGRLLGRLEVTLETKFGAPGLALARRFGSADAATLEKVEDAVRAATTLEEIERLLPS